MLGIIDNLGKPAHEIHLLPPHSGRRFQVKKFGVNVSWRLFLFRFQILNPLLNAKLLMHYADYLCQSTSVCPFVMTVRKLATFLKANHRNAEEIKF